MELRLGKSKRIRLDESEMAKLNSERLLREKFQISRELEIEVEVAVSSSARETELRTDRGRLILDISPSALKRLTSCENRKEGIEVGDFRLQADMWSASRRNAPRRRGRA